MLHIVHKSGKHLFRATCLGPRGTGTPGGPREGWPHIRAVVGHTRRPPGRRCRREVCPEAAACCPPSQPSTSPQVVPPMCAQLEI